MFVIILSYTSPLEKMDQLRPAHLAFLDKYYKKEIFVASGRQVPIKGGVILARGVERSALEKIIQEDPFYREKVAEFEIIEFTVNGCHPALEAILKG